ncbi:MAG TPA: FadR/GntR family transcriptional regulator [Alphaproteobacteria bacterium]|nr:FadR/GntR family transcriptional regulator [Alphaproteobacteria bacterium]
MVFAQIHEFIRLGRFRPGSRLPPEREFAALFNASRPTVREALYRAELLGLIEVRHGAGSVVVSSSPRAPVDRPLHELIRSELHRVNEFFDIRRAVEGWCAAQAAKNPDRASLAAMRRHLAEMKRRNVTDEEWEQSDIAFHTSLAACTGNPLVMRIIEVLRDGFSAFYRFKRFVPNREEQKIIWRHHFEIYDAVRRKRPEAARKAIVDHMDFIERKLDEGVGDIRK